MFILTCLVLCLTVQLSLVYEVTEILTCENEGAQFGCPENKLIQIDSAVYGRQSNEICSTGKHYNLRYCLMDNVTRSIMEKCNGEKSCHFKVDNSITNSDPCFNVPKYLKIRWHCVPGYEGQRRYHECRSSTFRTYICEDDNRNIHCNQDEMVIISEALFGRDNSLDDDGDGGKCKFGRFNEDYCKPHDVTSIIQNQMCHNNYCKIKPDLQRFGDQCPGIFKYLRLSYYCCPRY